MGAFTVFMGAVPPRDGLRGRCAFAIFSFGTISCFFSEKNTSRAFKSTNHKHENTGGGLSYV
jgi:hypothetical protein